MNNYCEFEKTKVFNKKNYKTIKINDNFLLTRIKINSNELSKKLGKNKGIYSTIFCNNFDYQDEDSFYIFIKALTSEIKYYLNALKIKITENSKFFVVGLGNQEIQADKLGFDTCKKIISTHSLINKNKISKEIFSNVFSLSPSVESVNGLTTGSIVKSLADSLNPTLVILIDSMSCKRVKYLNNTIQLSTDGFAPGSEISGNRLKINKEFLNKPVLTIGCPLVIAFKSLIKTNRHDFLTSKDIYFYNKKFSDIISFCLNKILHKKLKKDEILYLSK